MLKFNRVIKQKMESKGDTIIDLAKALKVSVSRAKHIRWAACVPITENIINILAKRYGINRSYLFKVAGERNRYARRYLKNYREKRAG